MLSIDVRTWPQLFFQAMLRLLFMVVYFITVSTFFVFIAFKSLELRCRKSFTIKVFGLYNKDIYWLHFTAMGLMLFVLLIISNMMSIVYNQRFDLTQGKTFSLSHISDDVLKSLKKELKITMFYTIGERYQYEELFALMSQASRKFTYRLINFGSNPVRAQNLGIDAPGSGIIE